MVEPKGAETLGRAVAHKATDLPGWIWLPWIPQLMTSLQRPEVAVARRILSAAASSFPQQLYWHVRPSMLAMKEAAVKAVQEAKAQVHYSSDASPHVPMCYTCFAKLHACLLCIRCLSCITQPCFHGVCRQMPARVLLCRGPVHSRRAGMGQLQQHPIVQRLWQAHPISRRLWVMSGRSKCGRLHHRLKNPLRYVFCKVVVWSVSGRRRGVCSGILCWHCH